jgi:hypothetical protein
VFDALQRAEDKIELIDTRHEEMSAFYGFGARQVHLHCYVGPGRGASDHGAL